MKQYSVKGLAKLAGVSVRTLHLYDQMNLLKPGHRTDAGYRLYGEPELLRLQQILFYKEMGIGLEAIGNILDDPDFDLVQALENHKVHLQQKQKQTEMMINTINKTILNLKEKTMLKHEELYEGLSKEEARQYRKEAVEKYGEHAIERAEYTLKNRNKEELEQLKQEQKDIAKRLASLINMRPGCEEVQTVIHLHYINIRKFWGTDGDGDSQAETYKGLADLYISDERFLQTESNAQPQLAQFIKEAIHYFTEHSL